VAPSTYLGGSNEPPKLGGWMFVGNGVYNNIISSCNLVGIIVKKKISTRKSNINNSLNIILV